jgi:hypothetical protein
VPPEAVTSLLQLQQAMAQQLRDGPVDDPGWEIYRNNARQFFRAALAATYPVLLRRVGEDYFRQLARQYQSLHPSRSGDLHWVGQAFPAWLGGHLAATPYAWLAELAQLEWACAEAAVAPRRPALGLDSLAGFAPEALDRLVVGFQPSMRLVASRFAVATVWRANQRDAPGPPVVVESAAEHCVAACIDEQIAVYSIDPGEFALLANLHGGSALAQALERSAVAADVLARVLDWAFRERLVTALSLPSA